MTSPSRGLGLDIAGMSARLRTRDPAVARVARQRYGRFVTDGASAEWTIEVGERAAGLTLLEDVVVRPGDGGRRFVATRHDFTATVELDRRRAHVVLGEVDDIALDAFVRVAWSLALVDASGLLLHAASLSREGQGYLFCGPSGSGKTTVARLSPDAELLSDEISCVRLDAGGAWCHGTPFAGDLARAGDNVRRPLRAVHFLERSRRHERVALTPRDALVRLLPNVLFFARDADLVAQVLAIAADLVDRVPCFRLGFCRDPGFWSLVHA
jgi:hypothetical protein